MAHFKLFLSIFTEIIVQTLRFALYRLIIAKKQ